MGPFLPSATAVKIGEVSLKRITRLLLGLLGQVERLKRRLQKSRKQGSRPAPTLKTSPKPSMLSRMGLKASNPMGPGPQKTPSPWLWKQRHAPYQRPTLLDCPGTSSAPRVPSPPISPRLQSPIGAPTPLPPAPATHYPALVKVDHPDAYTGKIGSKAKQWLTCMLAWTRLNLRMFPTNQEVLSFLLMNMKDSAGAWAHPHLDQLGSHQAIIQTVKGFKLEFLAAFGNPDATRAAERKITTLTQSSTCADYITKFRTLAMELDWNNAALRGQFACGLHWELQNAALVINNALRKERASHPPKDSKPSRPSNPARGQVPVKPLPVQRKLSDNPTLCWKKNRTAAAPLAPASSAVKWAISLQNAAQAGKPPH
ncbi:Retrotransposon gag protein [Rhizoctonia solani]|uniref:Retrotransposon gag protein n=1 Tax=Rhizoctonia solani TaxID=456999 RepID=A0A8H7IJK6_9AGAM|nr:Retrotransposon gag protein [Rhizoctonia solani]